MKIKMKDSSFCTNYLNGYILKINLASLYIQYSVSKFRYWNWIRIGQSGWCVSVIVIKEALHS